MFKINSSCSKWQYVYVAELFISGSQVALLSRGQMLYFGAGDKMVPYFSELGYQCPTYTNPSDYFSKFKV